MKKVTITHVVAIRLFDNLGKRYLKIHYEGPFHTISWRLVKNKSEATRLENKAVAEILSDEFWRAHWNHERYDSRSVDEIRTPVKAVQS